MPHLLSNVFDIPVDVLEEKGVFNCFLDVDTPFFINIKRLQVTEVPEFKETYNNINNYFADVALLLQKAKSKDSRCYREAVRMFSFSEVNEINLGLSKGRYGSGFGQGLREKVVADAYEIVQEGIIDPRIFHLLGLFEEGIGPDRISDMIARLSYNDIKLYSQHMFLTLGITPENFKDIKFADGIPFNPYKNCLLFLVPVDILQKIPIAKDWDDIDTVCDKNRIIRKAINDIIGEQWKKCSSRRKKEILKKCLMDVDKAKGIVNAYEETAVEELYIYDDREYSRNLIKEQWVIENQKFSSSYDTSIFLFEEFKRYVEYNRGWKLINNVKNEKLVQNLIYCNGTIYLKEHNWDISPESDAGRGPVDFKISRGNDKTVIEIKLTSNQQCVHGLEVQIEEYARAEGAENKLFLLIDNGIDSYRVAKVKEKHQEMTEKGLNPAHLIIIDAKEKKSASKY